MLASTVQFSTYDQTPPTRPRRTRAPPKETRRYEKQDGPAETTVARSLRTQQRAYDRPPAPTPFPTPRKGRRTRSSSSCRPNWSAFHPRAPPQKPAAPHKRGAVPSWARLCTTSPKTGGEVLLRKEVIQPHLPVRLPCYDFVPIADPAFDGSLHKGWATGFGRYRLS